ncbi:hypothetical protein Trihar35433_8045 [Trichoderma harzianum]|nr:hypothetical protein Trihar35433_8045 [Trichoderma harzianum]
MGFSIQIPFGPTTEEDGFGICHGLDYKHGRAGIIPTETYSIDVQMPANSVVTHDELNEAMLKRLPESTKTMCRIDIYPKDISEVVVKGYGMPFANKGHECDAFINGTIEGRFTLLNILQQQSFSHCRRRFDKAAPNQDRSIDSKWTLNLTPSFWLLMVLHSPAVREIHEDDPKAIHEMQQQMDIRRDCERLRAAATGKISWQEYESGQMVQEKAIEGMFGHLIWSADILCAALSMSMQEPYSIWKMARARGVVVDEAGNISRPDLYRVWDNTMLPCLLGGDDKQLPPAVMTVDDKDIEGDHINRLAEDAKLSALEFSRASGWPIYRLQ